MARGSDSIIKQFRGLKQEYRADYAAAKPSRFRRTRSGLGGTADAHYADEAMYFRVIETMRDMERNDPILRSTLGIAVNQQVQGGFRYDPKTPDLALNKELKLWWSDWADDPRRCDIAGKLTFQRGEIILTRAGIRDGDMCVLPLESGHLQYMECERLKTPFRSVRNIVHGVELDDTRRPTAYYFTRGLIDPMARVERVGDMSRVEAYDEDGFPQVFHFLNETRSTQTRGVSEFIAAQDMLGVRDDVEFALLIKQQLAAMVVGEWENTSPNAAPPGAVGEQRNVIGPTGGLVTLEDVEPGTILNPPPGKKFKLHASMITSQESLQHMRQIMQIVGLQVAMPLIMMLMDASETNFSGWRGAIEIARSMFRDNQRNLRSHHHRWVAEWRMRWEMRQPRSAMGKSLRRAYARHGDALFRHGWQLPAWPYIQPAVDAQADALKLSTMLSSPRRVAADRGHEWDEIVDETIEDNTSAITKAIIASKKIYAKTGESVHYRELLNRDLFKGGQLIDTEEIVNPAPGTKAPAQPAAAA